MRLIGRYLKSGDVFLEVGPGDCGISLAVAETASRVYAVDVSTEAVGAIAPPENFSLAISDGVTIPVPEGSVDVAWSAQLMEHLHPDDAREQLENICRALRPGGVYICITPNRISGPHDISKRSADVAEGFHLREYTNRELHDLFCSVGFGRLCFFVGGKGVYIRVPYPLLLMLESVAGRLPRPMRKRLFGNVIGLALFGIVIVGEKSRD
jgi:SAM-dependent methyltransferase